MFYRSLLVTVVSLLLSASFFSSLASAAEAQTQMRVQELSSETSSQIKRAVLLLEGVRAASVNPSTRQLTVTHDDAQVSRNDLVQALQPFFFLLMR